MKILALFFLINEVKNGIIPLVDAAVAVACLSGSSQCDGFAFLCALNSMWKSMTVPLPLAMDRF